METLHPAFSAFPLPLLVAWIVLEIFGRLGRDTSLERATTILALLYGGSLVAAFLSGYEANEVASQTFVVAEEVVASHHGIGRLLLLIAVPLLGVKFILPRAVHGVAFWRTVLGILLAVSLCIAVYTSYLGGQLVFRHGAGVFAQHSPQVH